MKKACLAALSLAVIGGALIAASFALGGNFLTSSVQTVTVDDIEEFTHIKIDASAGDIVLQPSEDGKVHVVCTEDEKIRYTAEVEGDTLVIREQCSKKWMDYVGIDLVKRQVTLQLPAGEYGSLYAELASGSVTCEGDFIFADATVTGKSGNIRFSSQLKGTLRLSTLSGKISLYDTDAVAVQLSTASGEIRAERVRAEEISGKSASGRVALSEAVASAGMKVQCSSGNIVLERCDASEMTLSSRSGSVSGTLLRGMLFDASSRSGRIQIPESVKDGGKCTLATISGDIRVQIAS